MKRIGRPELGAFLRAEINKRGWSDRQTAIQAGIDKSTLSSILLGEANLPRLDTLYGLSLALEVPLARLIELVGFRVEPGEEPAEGRRRAILLEADDDLVEAFDSLARLPLADRDAVLEYIRFQVGRRSPDRKRDGRR